MLRRRWLYAAIGTLAVLLAQQPLLSQSGPTTEVVDGWTGPLDYTLLADGTALNLTGMTVTLILTKPDGTVVDTTGDVTVTDAAAGWVRYTPDATDLAASESPLRMRWKVVDGAGAVVYHPSARPAVIVIHEV
jgi:hypothetical protein